MRRTIVKVTTARGKVHVHEVDRDNGGFITETSIGLHLLCSKGKARFQYPWQNLERVEQLTQEGPE